MIIGEHNITKLCRKVIIGEHNRLSEGLRSFEDITVAKEVRIKIDSQKDFSVL